MTTLQDFLELISPYMNIFLFSLLSTQKLLKVLMEWQLIQHVWIYVGKNVIEAVENPE